MLPVPLIFTSSWASGINSYAVVLLLGLYGRFGHVAQVPSLLEKPGVLDCRRSQHPPVMHLDLGDVST